MIEDARPNLAIDRTWDGQHIGDDEAVELRLSQRGDTLRVEVDAPFHGDPPPPGPPGPTWALWEHEVVELFLLGADGRLVYSQRAIAGTNQLDTRALIPGAYSIRVLFTSGAVQHARFVKR